MLGEIFSTPRQIMRATSADGTGAPVFYNNGKMYYRDEEGHTLVLGSSGSGKTQSVQIPYLMNVIERGESAIFTESKNNSVYNEIKDRIPNEYRTIVINFADLNNSDTCRILDTVCDYINDENELRQTTGQDMLAGIAEALYPQNHLNDPFWESQAASAFRGVVLALCQLARQEEVNFMSAFYMLKDGLERFGASSTYLKEAVKCIENNFMIDMQLYTTLNAPKDTSGGIHATYMDGLSRLIQSKSINTFINTDGVKISELEGDKPTLIFINIPDSSDVFATAAGMFISVLMSHYISIADTKYGGKLPIKFHCILDELGTIGRAIPAFKRYMATCRSRNIKIVYVVQALQQLIDLYGKENAGTILSNSDVKMVFRVNDWDGLNEMSNLLGEKDVYSDGKIIKAPLLTPSDLNAMKVGQCLVNISGNIKFVSYLPPAFKLYDFSKKKTTKVEDRKDKEKTEIRCFDVKEYVKIGKRHKFDEKQKAGTGAENIFAPKKPGEPVHIPTFDEFMKARNAEKEEKQQEKQQKMIDDLVRRIDKKIEELQREEQEEAERRAKENHKNTYVRNEMPGQGNIIDKSSDEDM